MPEPLKSQDRSVYHHIYPRNPILDIESSPLNAAIISRVAFSFSTLFTSFGIRKVHLRYIASILFAEEKKIVLHHSAGRGMPCRGQETKETGHSVGASQTDGRDRSWSNGPPAHERAYGHPGAAVDPKTRPRRTAWLPSQEGRGRCGWRASPPPIRPDPARPPQVAAIKRTRPVTNRNAGSSPDPRLRGAPGSPPRHPPRAPAEVFIRAGAGEADPRRGRPPHRLPLLPSQRPASRAEPTPFTKAAREVERRRKEGRQGVGNCEAVGVSEGGWGEGKRGA